MHIVPRSECGVLYKFSWVALSGMRALRPSDLAASHTGYKALCEYPVYFAIHFIHTAPQIRSHDFCRCINLCARTRCIRFGSAGSPDRLPLCSALVLARGWLEELYFHPLEDRALFARPPTYLLTGKVLAGSRRNFRYVNDITATPANTPTHTHTPRQQASAPRLHEYFAPANSCCKDSPQRIN